MCESEKKRASHRDERKQWQADSQAGQQRRVGAAGRPGSAAGIRRDAAQLSGSKPTMSAPCTAVPISWCDSWAASSPSSGLPPVPAQAWGRQEGVGKDSAGEFPTGMGSL